MNPVERLGRAVRTWDDQFTDVAAAEVLRADPELAAVLGGASEKRINLAVRVIGAARQVASDAPEKRAKYATDAKVSWRRIEELRAALAAWDAE